MRSDANRDSKNIKNHTFLIPKYLIYNPVRIGPITNPVPLMKYIIALNLPLCDTGEEYRENCLHGSGDDDSSPRSRKIRDSGESKGWLLECP